MTNKGLLAVASGLAVMALTQFIVFEMHHAIFDRCCASPSAALYVSAGTKVLRQLMYLSPGFVAGWIAATRGILLGFITGMIGEMVWSIISPALLFHLSWGAQFQQLISIGGLVYILGAGVVTGIACAAAGGTAQLLRGYK